MGCFMGMLGGILPNIQWLSGILIGCIFDSMVYKLCRSWFGEWNFHLQEIKQTLDCHRLILLTKYNSKLVGLG